MGLPPSRVTAGVALTGVGTGVVHATFGATTGDHVQVVVG
jgi:hypothetical protein